MTRGRESNGAVFGRKRNGVENAPLHAPCPVCYSDCTPGQIIGSHAHFICESHGEHWGFALCPKAARRHTTWLLTRGSVRVQVALANEGIQ